MDKINNKKENDCMIYVENEIQENSTYLQRLFSLCIDFIVLIITLCVFGLIILLLVLLPVELIFKIELEGSYIEALILCIFFVWYVIWHKTFRKTGQTIGTMLMKIRVVPINGTKLSFRAAIFRVFLCAPQFAIFTAYANYSRNQDQSILDIISHTYTVKLKKKIKEIG